MAGWWLSHPAYPALVKAYEGRTRSPEYLAFLALNALRTAGFDVKAKP